MLNPNRPIKPLDDRPKTRSEIADIIGSMMHTDENGNPENETDEQHTAYRSATARRYFYTQTSELSTLPGVFFIHKLAIRDSIDNGIDLHCHKKCSARSDAMNITEIHER